MARIRYDVPTAKGWTHIGGQDFQALIRVPRSHPLAKVLGGLADRATMDVVLAAYEAAGSDLDGAPAYAGVQTPPVCRAMVRGAARAILSNRERREIVSSNGDDVVDLLVDWGVQAARLEPTDDSETAEVTSASAAARPEVRDDPIVAVEVEPVTARSLSGETVPASVPSVALAEEAARWLPPPAAVPDAWWLQELGMSTNTPTRPPQLEAVHAPPTETSDQLDVSAEAPTEAVPVAPEDDRGAPARQPSRWLSADSRQSRKGAEAEREIAPLDAAYVLLSSGETLPFEGAMVLGRAPAFDLSASSPRVAVRLAPRDQMVSRTHVRLERDGSSLIVSDLKSKNGTVVFVPGEPGVALRAGEHITVSLTGGVLVVLGSTASAWIATGQPTDTGGKAES